MDLNVLVQHSNTLISYCSWHIPTIVGFNCTKVLIMFDWNDCCGNCLLYKHSFNLCSISIVIVAGTPINRIPIMAKQVLDLYELYQLVVARGGLVEVINKKIWREITKGLNLPSSITSAAFTLRTQWVLHNLVPLIMVTHMPSPPGIWNICIPTNVKRKNSAHLKSYKWPSMAIVGKVAGLVMANIRNWPVRHHRLLC